MATPPQYGIAASRGVAARSKARTPRSGLVHLASTPVDLVLDRQRLGPTERRLAEPGGQVLVPFHDAKPTARGVHARLQRVRHVKGPPTIFDAARLAVLRPHDVD